MTSATHQSLQSLWLRRFAQGPAEAPRLICFPHAGGSASYYLPVARALAGDADVVAVQYPGRQDRRLEPCIDTIEGLADSLTPLLRDGEPRSTAFFGHSMGATLAFEVARRLEADGVVLSALFVSGRRAPSTVRDERDHLLDDERLLSEVRSLSGTDPQVFADDELVRMVLPAMRNDYKAAETYRYRPGPPLRCPVFALIGTEDPKVNLAEADAWATHTLGSFQRHAYSGGHFFLNSHAAAVTALVGRHIAAHGS